MVYDYELLDVRGVIFVIGSCKSLESCKPESNKVAAMAAFWHGVL